MGACGKPSIDAATALHKAAQALLASHSATVDVKYPPGVPLEAPGFKNYQVVSSTSRIKLPGGDSFTTVKVKGEAGALDVEIVTIADTMYIRLFSFLPYSALTPAQRAELPSPSRIFSSTDGLPAVLPRGGDPRLEQSESVDQHDCLKVATSYDGGQVARVLPLLGGAGTVQTVLWIDSSSFQVRRAVLTGAFVTAGQSSQVEVHLHDFDAPVVIPSPG
jgi:hypothetical protein